MLPDITMLYITVDMPFSLHSYWNAERVCDIVKCVKTLKEHRPKKGETMCVAGKNEARGKHNLRLVSKSI